jgi:hypothetical protein
MRIYRTISLTVFTAGLLFCGLANAEDLPSASATDASAADQAGGGNAAPPSNLQTDITIYPWLPGIHGTLNGFGQNVYYRASLSDLVNHSGLAINGVYGLKYKRFVFIGDFSYAPLSANKSHVFNSLPNQPFVNATLKYTQFVLDPEVGFRMLDGKRLKVDALIGYRFWHNGITLNVQEPVNYQHFYVQNNWADLVLGARIVYALTPKLEAQIWGDGGGFGAAAQLDYNMVGALTYKIKPRWSFNVGWRYLFVDYNPHFISNSIAESGLVFGSTIHLSGRQ